MQGGIAPSGLTPHHVRGRAGGWAATRSSAARIGRIPAGSGQRAASRTSQASVTGEVRLKLYRGNVIVTGRRSPNSL
ncbi:MAG TPA: hypothetical protein VE684_20820, partial [Crenalkalicoccus sp.]|nr:hypothetical protein [Crenalkalicoccus sp.]